ncbi:malonic semialdehyde reductase [Pararhodobacter oceanensis]|uniref:Malonic semialdehyde reductase n=1 Tax=Pararhodobacter oceanensis TaxID=2172121 RepID=A0A2T8HQF1_9RHOB|nr:malonic semialdehyde reductase [Pararhodobacter oceanensis]PVH27635.1 malonic semialdehyde reductase [Pararhodobacter oceanensis]
MNASAPKPCPEADPREAAQAEIRELRARIPHLDEDAIDLILTKARSHYAWQDRPVSEAQLRRLYEITKMGATSMNCSPARFFFITSPEGKAKLTPALKPKNVAKMLSAPVTVVIAEDLAFWERLDVLFPHEDRKPLFRGKSAYIRETAARNATLQGGYMMIAARAMGLDCGPMSGFDNAAVDRELFSGTTLRSNFLLNLGYADETAIFPKLPRLPFEEACRIM